MDAALASVFRRGQRNPDERRPNRVPNFFHNQNHVGFARDDIPIRPTRPFCSRSTVTRQSLDQADHEPGTVNGTRLGAAYAHCTQEEYGLLHSTPARALP